MKWALKYERNSGRIYCHNVRSTGKPKRKKNLLPTKARNVWEAEKAVNEDNRLAFSKTIKDNKAKDKVIYDERRVLKTRQGKEWDDLSKRNQDRIASIESNAKEDIAKAVYRVRKDFKPQWQERYHAHEKQAETFLQDEDKFIGRIKNRVSAIDFGAIFKANDRKKAISQAFDAFASAGGRMAAFKTRQKRLDAALATKQRAEEQKRPPTYSPHTGA